MSRYTTLISGSIALAAFALFSAFYSQAQTPAAPPAPFDTALLNAANGLFSQAQLPSGDSPVELVIDPLIDGVSGAQSVASHLMEQRLTQLAEKSYPRFKVQPFTTEVIERSPVVLVGTLTAINNAGEANAAPDVYRICLALADLRSKTIISKGFAKALPQGIDVTPTPSFTDNPIWADDEATIAYIKTCQGTKAGDPINPLYIERIGTATLISDGITEYDNKRYREALAFYRTASRLPGGDQLRVRNGVYLSNWKLGRRDDAALSFGDLVSYGLKNSRLAVRFLFQPGSTQFFKDEQVSSPYPVWLQQIASHAAESNTCLQIVGHSEATDSVLLNERLSVLRAQTIKTILEQADRRLTGKLIANGVGSREPLIGTGKNDASDALDRRVEFKVLKC